MCDVYIRECLDEMALAESYYNEMVDLDDISLILEADEEGTEASAAVEKNTQASKGFLDHAKALFAKMRKFIAEMLQKIANFFGKNAMAAKDKKDFEEFEKACKADPALAHKRVTVPDYQKIQAEYDELIKEAEKADQMYNAGKTTDAEALMNKLKNKAASIGKAGVTTIECQLLKNYAISNRNIAKAIQSLLLNNEKFVAGLEESVGKAEAERFKKDIAKNTKGRYIARFFILNILNRKLRTAQGCVDDVKDIILKDRSKLLTTGTGRDMARRAMGNEDVKQVVGDGKDLAKRYAKGSIEGMSDDLAAGTAKYRAGIKNAKSNLDRFFSPANSADDIPTYVRKALAEARAKRANKT